MKSPPKKQPNKLNESLETLEEGDFVIENNEKVSFTISKPRFKGNLDESQMIHPLYTEYDRLYEEELNMFMQVTNLGHALMFLDFYLGI